MSQLQDLRARMRLDNSQFSRGLNQARGETQQFGAAVRSMIRSVAGPLAAAFSFREIIRGARQGASEIDNVAKSARALQGSIGGVRAVEVAMEDAGVPASVLRQEIQNLNRQLANGGADTAMRALGLEAEKLARMDVDEKMATIADRINELGLDAGATNAILQQFGVRNRDMALLMMQGGNAIRNARRDVEEYGLALSEVDSARIEEANDRIGRLSVVGQYLRQELARGLVPAFGELALKITESMREGGALRRLIDVLVSAMTNFRKVVDAAGVAVAVYAGTRIPMLITALGASAGAIVAVRGQMSLMIAQMYAGAGAAALLTGATRTLATAIAMAGGPMGVLLGVLGGATAAMILFRDTTDTTAPILGEAERAIDQISAALEFSSSTAMPEAQRQTLALTNENIKLARSAYAAAEAELAKAKAAAQYAQNELGLQQAFSPTGQHTQAQSDLERALSRLTEASRQLRDAQKGLQDRVNEGMLTLSGSTGEIESKVARVRSELEGLTSTAGGMNALRNAIIPIPPEIDQISDASERARNAAESAFVSFVTGAQSARQAVSQLLMMLAELAAQSAFKSLFPGAGGGGGKAGGDGGRQGLLGLGGFLGFLDSGGTIGARQWAVVAEKRDEFVNGVLVRGPANVVGGAETSRRLAAGAGNVDVRLFVDQDGNWQAAVERISGNVAVHTVQSRTPAMIGHAFKRARETRSFN